MNRMCWECGVEHERKIAARETAEQPVFCCHICRVRFLNRRRDRGAELYDLFMVLRFERGMARAKGIWTMMCALASAYRDADKYARAGRQSWQPVDLAMRRIPMAFSREGDKR